MEFEKDSNYSLILDMVRRKSPISRVLLAKALYLSKVTVSTIINELIDEGLIIETGEGTGGEKGGRKIKSQKYINTCVDRKTWKGVVKARDSIFR